MTKKNTKFVPASDKLQAKWTELRASLDAAAKPITGKAFSISPFYLHDIPGADKELDGALRSAPSGVNAHGSCAVRDNRIGFEISWAE